MGLGEMGSSSSSSDEDEEHKAALRSVAVDSDAVINFATPKSTAASARKRRSKDGEKHEDDGNDNGANTSGLKFYQTRVQDLLYKQLDKVFEDTSVPVSVQEETQPVEGFEVEDTYDGETRLFSNARPGVHLKRTARQKKNEKRRVLPHLYENSDEDTTENDSRLKAAAVEGLSIKSQAKMAARNAQGRFLAAVADLEEKEKEEEERVKRMRKLRGEEWLPSVAKEMVRRVKAEREESKTTNEGALTGTVVDYK